MYAVMYATGMEISTHLLTKASVKSSWVSTNCEVFSEVLKVTHPHMASAVNI